MHKNILMNHLSSSHPYAASLYHARVKFCVCMFVYVMYGNCRFIYILKRGLVEATENMYTKKITRKHERACNVLGYLVTMF
jgi:hypothetical protein